MLIMTVDVLFIFKLIADIYHHLKWSHHHQLHSKFCKLQTEARNPKELRRKDRTRNYECPGKKVLKIHTYTKNYQEVSG